MKENCWGKSLYYKYLRKYKKNSDDIVEKDIIYNDIIKNLSAKKNKYNNITLIGMPASGKSSIGKALAKKLDMDFVDVDDVIIDEYKLSLKEIIDKYGDDEFRRIEERINSELKLKNSVISPGGSVVYGKSAMKNLRNISTVIYLDLDYVALRNRIGDIRQRGVTLKEGQTLKDLYDERVPLYERYCDIVISCMKKNINNVIKDIILMYNMY